MVVVSNAQTGLQLGASSSVHAHPAVRAGVQAAFEEYEARESLEAKVARGADGLECLFQAVEYCELPHPELGRHLARLAHDDVGGTAHAARDWDQAALFQFEGERGGVLIMRLLFFGEPGHVDVVRRRQ
ncbi:HD domain-containing protein [Streptomyces zaomyceticus]|uniref:HD domain-containing protein n=1 Tax=Streptomyces zaomyceticus TaxID=68286 RepID=UPI0037A8406A